MTEKEVLPSEVNAAIVKAKADGHSVFSLKISGVKYIYRSLNRTEYRDIQEQLLNESEKAKIEATKAKKGLPAEGPEVEAINAKLEREGMAIRDRGEETLVKKALLHPHISSNTPAGVPTTIADRILQASGFGVEEEPELL